MITTNKINVFMHRREVYQTDAVQGDTARVLELSLYAGAEKWPVPNRAGAQIRFRKPDGSGGCYDTLPDGTSAVRIEDNRIACALAPQVLTVAGTVELQVVLAWSAGELATFTIYIHVQEDPSLGTVGSEDYVSLSQWVSAEVRDYLDEAQDELRALFAIPGAFFVHVYEGNSDTGYVADKTYAEIGENSPSLVGTAHADRPVFCVLWSSPLKVRGLDYIILPLSSHDPYMQRYLFTRVDASDEVMVEIGASGVNVLNWRLVRSTEIPKKLPNPYALTINGQSYDGSKKVDIEVTGGSGEIPYIGANGNWWIGEEDSGVKAAGEDGRSAAGMVLESADDAQSVYRLYDSDDGSIGTFTVRHGKDGGYYTPTVVDNGDGAMMVTFTPSKEDMPSVEPVMVELPVSGGNQTVTVEKKVEFDSVEENKVYTKAFPTGVTLNGYDTYNKAVTAGEVYYITSRPVENEGYGVAHFFNGDTFISVVGEYPATSGMQTNFEVTVPEGATIMRIIPGAGYGETRQPPVMWQWGTDVVQTDAAKICYSNYVKFDGETCIVKAKYNDTEDIAFCVNPGGGNHLPDIHRIYTVANSERLNNDTAESRLLMHSQTDLFSPHVVKAVNNGDGDAPENSYFTGGNHQTNNAGSGGAVTARSEGIASVRCDNVVVNGEAWGSKVEIRWINYIQGYNTSKADGTGREIMREEITLTISGAKINAEIRHYALEDIIRTTYYGLQMVAGNFDAARYIGGSNRIAYDCGGVSTNSGNKNCRIISLATVNGDVLEIGIENVDLGTFEYNNRAYSAFMETTSKSYFGLIFGGELAQNAGEMTVTRGYYSLAYDG